MTPTRKHLLDLIVEPDKAYNMNHEDLYPLRIAAAQELFEERISQIPLLKHRADEYGIKKIEKLADIVPLLFAHTVYKSYPSSFVEKGQWDRLSKWLDGLSVEDVTKVDMTGVTNLDEWLDRLWANGHRVLSSSGTTGKCSFLNQTVGDQENKRRHHKYTSAWPYAIADNSMRLFWMGPKSGPNTGVESFGFGASNWAREGEAYALIDEPIRISEVSRMAAMRKRMAEGKATPEEIAASEEVSEAKANSGKRHFKEYIDRVLSLRHEPMYLSGLWAQHIALIERARELGIPDGDFHPKTIIGAGGGIKGVKLPPDYREIVSKFYGDVIRPAIYGMTELGQIMPRCEEGYYHIPPGVILLLLDEAGEKLLNPEGGVGGVIEGRSAFLDLSYEGRWGGAITGDKISVDFSPTCKCGRTGPVIYDNIVRYAQAGEEDKITCAGTIDAYIRGSVDE